MAFHFFGDMPEEIKQQLQAQMDRQDMANHEAAHSTYRILDEMEPEQLRFMREFLVRVGDDESALYFVGYITGILATWYGVCPACGKDHDEELAEVVGDEGNTDA